MGHNMHVCTDYCDDLFDDYDYDDLFDDYDYDDYDDDYY